MQELLAQAILSAQSYGPRDVTEHTFDELRKDGAMLKNQKLRETGVKFWMCSFKMSLAWSRFVTYNFADVPLLSSSFPVVGSSSLLSHSELSSLQKNKDKKDVGDTSSYYWINVLIDMARQT